jgi:hypothetical protein
MSGPGATSNVPYCRVSTFSLRASRSATRARTERAEAHLLSISKRETTLAITGSPGAAVKVFRPAGVSGPFRKKERSMTNGRRNEKPFHPSQDFHAVGGRNLSIEQNGAVRGSIREPAL